METQLGVVDSATTPLNNEACPACNSLLELDWSTNEKMCLNCLHTTTSRYKDFGVGGGVGGGAHKEDLLLDLNDVANSLSLLQLGNYQQQQHGGQSPAGSPLHSSPEVFPPKAAGDGGECPLHHSACLYWCYTCMMPACLVCTSQHHSLLSGHRTGPMNEAQSLLLSQLQMEMQAVKKIHSDTKLLTGTHREFLCQVVEACVSLEQLMREELASLNKQQQQACNNGLNEEDSTQFLLNKISFQLAGLSGPDEAAHLLRALQQERLRLHTKQQQLAMQLTLNRVIGSSNQVLDLHTFRQTVQNLRYSGSRGLSTLELLQSTAASNQTDPVALLANVCNARLYTKQLLASSLLTSTQTQSSLSLSSSQGSASSGLGQSMGGQGHQPGQQNGLSKSQQLNPLMSVLSPSSPLHSSLPRFFLDLEVDGIVEGRVVLETRPDVAPKMAKNFASLCVGEKGFGYKGCQVFQCWGGESCIAGDFECNSGRGGRSIYQEEPFFMPDDSKLPCIRAAIGMRRTQKKHHSQGLVGSQFRILLRDMPFFTGVFGHVIHGLELVERVSFLGDHQGFPRKLITVANCGLLS